MSKNTQAPDNGTAKGRMAKIDADDMVVEDSSQSNAKSATTSSFSSSAPPTGATDYPRMSLEQVSELFKGLFADYHEDIALLAKDDFTAFSKAIDSEIMILTSSIYSSNDSADRPHERVDFFVSGVNLQPRALGR